MIAPAQIFGYGIIKMSINNSFLSSMEKLSHLLALPLVWAQNAGASNGAGLFDILLIFVFVGLIPGFIIFSLIFWLWMFIDCLKRKFDEKVLWVIVLLGTFFIGIGFIGALIYYFLVRKKLIKAEAQK